MSNVTRIHNMKQGRRPHFISDWCEKRGLSQADLAKKLSADPGLVSRWYKGSTPSAEYQEKMAALFDCEVESLFRHPDDDWMTKFLKGRSSEEVDRVKILLETAFPRRDGTDG